ncbi:MAG TPA: cellulose synthase complex periplasmic endoglucanase BcsZ [Edaphobacter sp.]
MRAARCVLLAIAVLFALVGLETTGLAQASWPLWEAYTRGFIDAQGRVVDHNGQDRTTSEGQAYAMFFALVANDRGRFDKLFAWTQQNLAGGDLCAHLPAWSWGRRPDGNWGVIDGNPAADADLWMAYAFSEAGRIWHDPRYQKTGAALAQRVAEEEVASVSGLGTSLLPGPRGFHPEPDVWLLNPSYLPPPLLAYFTRMMPRGPWGAVEQSLERILAEGSANGFAMDWVEAGRGIRPSIAPAQLAAGENQSLPVGSYDAIRVYLWLGITEPHTPALHLWLEKVSGMVAYLKQHSAPPERVDTAGRVIGPEGPPGFSAALVPYLRAAGAAAQGKQQWDRLRGTRNATNGLFGKAPAYYDQNLALFSTGWVEGRYRFDRYGRLRVTWR